MCYGMHLAIGMKQITKIITHTFTNCLNDCSFFYSLIFSVADDKKAK